MGALRKRDIDDWRRICFLSIPRKLIWDYTHRLGDLREVGLDRGFPERWFSFFRGAEGWVGMIEMKMAMEVRIRFYASLILLAVEKG